MYESSTSTVVGSLQSSSNPTFQDQAVVDEIINLTTSTGTGGTDNAVVIEQSTLIEGTSAPAPAAGTEITILNVSESTTSGDAVVIGPTATKNVPVVIIQGSAKVDITLNDGATAGGPAVETTAAGADVPATGAQRVVVAGAGETKVTIADAKNTKLTLGTGNSTVVTGQGVDTVVAGLGNSTISAGTGNDYSVVKLNGAASNYTVTTASGHAVVTDKATGVKTDITKVQYVEVNGDDALIFAKDNVQASIATLYEVAFGKTVDAATLDQFFDSGKTVQQIAEDLVKSPEFATRNLLDDRSFINNLYQNTFGRNGETAGINYWLDSIATHKATRADLIRSFAEIHTLNLAADGHGPGAQHEAVLIGNITVVTGII